MKMNYRKHTFSYLKRNITAAMSCVTLLLLVQNVMAKDSIEISSSNDFEAPEIEHNLKNDVTRDKKGNVVIKAKVTDEYSVNSVSLFFRDSGNNKYRKREMLLEGASKDSIYKASIPKAALGGDRIEYYFEADDKVGNKKLKGLEFSPLKREISDLAIVNGNSVNIAEKTPEPETKKAAAAPAEEPVDSEPKVVREVPTTSLDAPMVWIPGF